MQFIVQRAWAATQAEGVWEDITAGGDTPEKAIDALTRAGAVGVYRILMPFYDIYDRRTPEGAPGTNPRIKTLDFEIVEEKTCRAIVPDGMPKCEPPSDSG